MKNCPVNPLRRHGSRQGERLLRALVPSNVRLDDRSMQDLIRYVYDLSKGVNYFNLQNTEDGDWHCFFSNEPTVLLALLATLDLEGMERDYLLLEQDYHKRHDAAEDDPSLTDTSGQVLPQLIGKIYQAAKRVQRTCNQLPPDHLLKKQIGGLIAKLRPALERLIGYHKAGSDDDISAEYAPFILGSDKATPCTKFWSPAAVFETTCEGEKKLQGNAHEDLTLDYFYNCILPDPTFDLEILHDLFREFFNALSAIVAAAQRAFQNSLHQRDDHQPHITLFFAFLNLFRYLQEQMNGLTKRHLDFYYETILGLQRRQELPDRVHLVFELAQNLVRHELKDGTPFDGGKDEDGRQRAYELEEAFALNHAKVEQLKTLAFLPRPLDVGPTGCVGTLLSTAVSLDPNPLRNIYAAPVANSKGGNGKPDPAVQWSPLGDNLQPDGEIGFAIASPMFYLGEGVRVILVSLPITQGAIGGDLNEFFEIQLSAEKEWVPIQKLVFDATVFNPDDFILKIKANEIYEKTPPLNTTGFIKIPTTSGFYISQNLQEIAVVLREDVPAITNFVGEPKEGEIPLNAKWPVLKLKLKQDDRYEFFNADSNILEGLRQMEVCSMTLKVAVFGVEKLVLQSGLAVFEPKRKFQPWGPAPEIGDAFLIGSWEVFQKKLTKLSVNLAWLGQPDYNDVLYHGRLTKDLFIANCSFLDNRRWSVPVLPRKIYDQIDFSTDTTELIPLNPREPFLEKFSQFDTNTERGFMQMELLQDYLHKVYPALYSIAAINYADTVQNPPIGVNNSVSDVNSSSSGTSAPPTNPNVLFAVNNNPPIDLQGFPKEPHTPTLKSVSLDYISEETINVGGANSDIEQFFHLHPFMGNEAVAIQKPGQACPPLLPLFCMPEGSPVEDCCPDKTQPIRPPVFITKCPLAHGNLFIGLKKLEPGQSLSLLFRVEEASGNPAAEAPGVAWSYLRGNEWVRIPVQLLLSDTTFGLTKTGIVKLQIPTDLSNVGTTILDPALNWLRVSAMEDLSVEPPQKLDGFPKMLTVEAQAVVAVLRPNGSAVAHLEAGLPANTISKPLLREVAVKKTTQPDASFGGRPPEADPQYYRRTSERLRHKNRAVTPWDYEHIVLEKNPQLHAAKCLNHTNGESELAPGYVAVAVVPEVKNRTGIHKFEPRMDEGTLEEIRRQLLGKVSYFVTLNDATDNPYLKVVNALFEPLHVSVCAKFRDGLDANQQRYKLDDDIKQYLAPWAFGGTAPIVFGAEVFKSQLLNFIEELDYVDVILEFEVCHNGQVVVGDLIRPTTGRSILTSYINPAAFDDPNLTDHEVKIVLNAENCCEPCGCP